MPSVTSSFGDGVTECRIKRLFNADLVGPRTLIVPIFLQPLLHSFSLSVKCTRKKSDLFRIWRSPLEIGFTTALSSYSQLFNTLRKNDSLAQNISDKGILLFVSFGNSSRSIGKIALIGHRLWTSLEAKILRPFRDWVGLARRPSAQVQRSTLPVAPPTISLLLLLLLVKHPGGHYWKSLIQEETERDGCWNWSEQCKGILLLSLDICI